MPRVINFRLSNTNTVGSVRVIEGISGGELLVEPESGCNQLSEKQWEEVETKAKAVFPFFISNIEVNG